jgi:hypothetical protein
MKSFLLSRLAASVAIARRARKEGRKPVFTLTEETPMTETTEPKRRIYTVTNSEDGAQQLIRATSPAAARNFAARIYSAELASQEDLVRLCAVHTVQDAE